MSTALMETQTEVKLTGHDRCDYCGAQAFVAAELATAASVLLFCGHHGTQHTNALKKAGWTIWDFTHIINEKPSVSTAPDDY